MRVLAVHNKYLKPGGEDVVFQAEAALLEAHGHDVVRFVTSNQDLKDSGAASLVTNTIWNRGSMRQVRELIQRTQPAVMHVHNTFPLLSPSIYTAARLERVPVVQTLHNFRIICPNALLYRNGSPCDDCVDTFTRWPGVVHGCYRGSRIGTSVVATMLATHAALGTFRQRVAHYIVMSEFAKRRFLEAGAIGSHITVKPNFLERDPGPGTHSGGYVLFVGRLSEEKGIRTLLAAASKITVPEFHLKIAGEGPITPPAQGSPRVEWLGRPNEVMSLMKDASLLVFPSECYEGCPMTILEALAAGLPVIASGHGSIAEFVSDGVTGLHFSPGDAGDLAAKITWALAHPDQLREMGRRGREEYERAYTAERNYQLLMDIYHSALDRAEQYRS